jgi:hypothetical protein
MHDIRLLGQDIEEALKNLILGVQSKELPSPEPGFSL